MDFIKLFFNHVVTAILGVNGKEAAFGGVIAVIGTTIVSALGGWIIALKFLLFCMAFDYITSLLAAWKLKLINSEVMFWGGIRKIVILGVIVFAGFLDVYLIESGLLQKPFIQTASYFFYIAREALSIVENLGKLDVMVPDVIKDKLIQIKESKKNDEKKDNN